MNAMDKRRNNPGRPTKYKPEYCEKIVEFMLEDGKPFSKPMVSDRQIVDHHVGYLPRFIEEFAHAIGVHVDTLREWRDKHPDFSVAYKKAKEIQLVKMVGGMISGVYIPSATIFTLKNMFGWKDKTEHSGDKDNPVHIHFDKVDKELL